MLISQDPVPVLSRMIVTPCFRLDPDLHAALDVFRESLETASQPANEEEGGRERLRIRVVVVDQITSLFKDHLVNTNAAGLSPLVVDLCLVCAELTGQAAMLTVMEDIAELTYTYNISTFVGLLTRSPAQSSMSCPLT